MMREQKYGELFDIQFIDKDILRSEVYNRDKSSKYDGSTGAAARALFTQCCQFDERCTQKGKKCKLIHTDEIPRRITQQQSASARKRGGYKRKTNKKINNARRKR